MKLERINQSVLYNVTKTRDGSLLDAIVSIECDGVSDREAVEAEIVRRVNCHEELVAALRAAQNCDHSCTPEVFEEIDSALAKSEGGAE